MVDVQVSHPRYDDLLTMLKLVSPKQLENNENYDKTYEKIIHLLLRKAIKDVMTYTHIPVEELPDAIDETIVFIAKNSIDLSGFTTPVDQKSNPNVSNLTEGDTSVSFKSDGEVMSSLLGVTLLTNNYYGILNNYRRLLR
ncbi:hypothetical protein FE410_05310 [Leuconostoc carnosum]|uniref:hypothetical protein n=1 Tax=Leuconostoc TaxID=1243 RepID=UPI001238F7C5|nr:hypothetical protein [Leuconostoc carnosum]KAA8371109.1 hypothetical protein FE414_05305 [Leuconostoc carnosum]KAA8382750.1 hypothetical protein FE410_05310 [Leuconostoc carnosum]